MTTKAYRDYQEAVYGSFNYEALCPHSYDYTLEEINGLIREAHAERWTPEEIQTIRTFYPIMGIKCHELLEHKTRKDVGYKAAELGLTALSSNKWSREEEEILREYYPTFGSETAELLTSRTPKSVRVHACCLGITYVG